MTTRCQRCRRVLFTVLLLAAWPPQAGFGAEQPPGGVGIAELVRPGDIVTVTPWIGRKVTGQVETTDECSLELRTARQFLTVPLSAIKTLRRHQPRPDNPGAKAMEDIASHCEEIACLPAAFAFLGFGAAIQGFDGLAHPPKVVYRAKRPLYPAVRGRPKPP